MTGPKYTPCPSNMCGLIEGTSFSSASITFCSENKEGEWRFAPYANVFERSDPNDVLWKFDIPSTERLEVLRLLNNDYNINAFSLIGSEESLMETMALRKLHFQEKGS